MENGNNNGVSSLCIRRSSVSLDDMVNGRHTLDSNGNGLAVEPIISGPPPPKICHQTATTAGKLMMRVHDAVDDNAASSGSVLSAFILPQIGGGKINGNVGIQLIHNTPERLSSSPSNSNNATLFLTTSMSPPVIFLKFLCRISCCLPCSLTFFLRHIFRRILREFQPFVAMRVVNELALDI